MRIGIISDTHGLLRPEVIESLDGCEAILHGGDINKQEIIDQLEKIAPVYAVRGNNDKEWAENIPITDTGCPPPLREPAEKVAKTVTKLHIRR